MITKTKIKQLERKARHITISRNRRLTVRNVIKDGRYVDEDGYLLTEEEIRLMKKENQEITKNGGIIIDLLSYQYPKNKQP